AQLPLEVGVDAWRLADGGRDRLARQVVLRGAQATGANDEVAAIQGPAHDLGGATEVVADRRHPIEVDAEVGQTAGEISGVRVDDVAEEELGPDRQKLSAHDLPSSSVAVRL